MDIKGELATRYSILKAAPRCGRRIRLRRSDCREPKPSDSDSDPPTSMPAVGRAPCPPPRHALSYAPLEEIARALAMAGAEVRNIPGIAPGGTV